MIKNVSACLALLLASAGVSAQSNMAARFDMELDGNNTVAESVTGNRFTVSHALAPENVDGAVGKALRLDGYSMFVNAEINSASLSTSALSVSLWCAPETYPVMNSGEFENAKTYIAGNLDESSRSGFAFSVTPEGCYAFECYTGGWKVECPAEGLKLKRYEWNHLVATIDAANGVVTLYNNGEKVGTAKCLSPINTGADAFIIGKSAESRMTGIFNLNTFNGLIDDIVVYNSVLTAEEAAKPAAANAADLSVPASRYASDILRPVFHGMPATAWTNECHGMAFSNGKYHLFFQKNANGPYMARLHWGHIYSDNLYKWHEDITALTPETSYDIKGCWSGAVFSDEEITGGKPYIIYTGVDNARATINMASPDDDNLTYWSKSEANPIINGRPDGLSDDFRDPYFFTSNGKKYIIVGTSKNNLGAVTLHEYNSATKTWSNDGRTFFSGTDKNKTGRFWEMPNITKIGDKWLFTATPLDMANGVEVIYWTGTINDDGTFSPASSSVTEPGKLELDGFSRDGYGLLSPTIFSHGGKTILMGIVPDKLPSEDNYNLGWAHAYSLPRECSIDASGQLVQKPYEGLKGMRTSVSYAKSDFTLDGEEPLSPVSGRQYEVCGEFVAGSGKFGFNLFQKDGKAVKLYYSPVDNRMVVDATGIERIVNDNGVFNGYYSSELPRMIQTGETVKINAFVDHSMLDVFINDTWAFSMRLFPTDADATGLSAFSEGGTQVNLLQAWTLDPDNGGQTSVSIENTDFSFSVSEGKICYNNIYDNAMALVYDLNGSLVLRSRLNVGSGSFGVNSKGVYILKVVTPEKTVSKKLILK